MENKQQIRLTLFGGFRLVGPDGNMLVSAARKSKALLAWLAINPDIQHPREKLAALLWPDSEEVAARHSLRQALTGLRKIIPADSNLLKTSKEFIYLNSDLIEVDVQNFLKALSKGDTNSLEHAVELYTGEFLEGCNPDSDMFNEWGMVYRNDYNERAAAAIELLLSQHLNNKDENRNYEQVISLALRLIAIDSVRESAYRALMLAHIRLGNHATALRWYRRCQHVLKLELDVYPDAETEALYKEELLSYNNHNPSLSTNNNNSKLASNKITGIQMPVFGGVGKDNQRVLYQVSMAIGGILDGIGGQSFLIRGENGVGKSELMTEIITLAKTHGFFCCHKKLSAKANASDEIILKELVQSFSNCLLNYPEESCVVPDEKTKSTCEINVASKLENVDEDISRLVKATASFQPIMLVVEHLHEAKMGTLNMLAELISSAGNCSMLLILTSHYEGEPLDPVWRGAMRGAPLTTIDMF